MTTLLKTEKSNDEIRVQFWVKGSNTFQIKEDLRSLGCVWYPEKRAWKTPEMIRNNHLHLRVKSLAQATDADLIPTGPSLINEDDKRVEKILLEEF